MSDSGLVKEPESRLLTLEDARRWSQLKPLSDGSVPPQKSAEIQALLDISNDIPGDIVARLETYIHNDPQSPFAADIKLRLGQYYKETGRYTRAYTHFLETWDMLKNIPDPQALPMADRALTQATYFLASIGRTDQAASLLEANQNRQFQKMNDYYWWERAANKVGIQKSHPERTFRCGIFAINAVARALNLNSDADALLDTQGQLNGFSLTELIPIAGKFGLKLTAVIDKNHPEIPVPSIVHLALEHYAAITEFKDGFYKVEDPTNGGTKWLTQQEINDEATGYFLIPTSLLTPSWQPVPPSEGSRIIGRGSSACPPEDPTDPGDECSNCGCGMPQWSVSQPYINLWMTDTPITYSPSKGPGITITLRHRQRNPSLQSPFNTSFGDGWHASILSSIDGLDRKTYFPGGQETKQWTLGQRGVFKNEIVTQLTSPSGYLVTYPDGSTMKYTYPSPNPSLSYQYLITEMKDANGDKLTYGYDTYGRLTSIVDADGGVTSVSYRGVFVNGGAGLDINVYRVITPDGRYAEFDNDSGVLYSIRDAQGITSSFTYNTSTFAISSLITPYGTTTFTYNPDPYDWNRWIKVTTPGNKVHAYYYIDYLAAGVPSSWSGSLLPAVPSSVLSNPNYSTTGRDERLSIHWDPKQWSSLSQTNFSAMTYNEFKKGLMTHWLSMDLHVFHAKNAVQEPSHNGSSDGIVTFYDYQGKSTTSKIELPSSVILNPRLEARVNPGGETWFQYSDRNTRGNPLNLKTSWTTTTGTPGVRSKSFTWSADGINRLSETDFNGQLLNAWAYDSNRNVTNHIQYASSTALYNTSYTYNSQGKLASSINPGGLVSTYAYWPTNSVQKGRLKSVVDSFSSTAIRTNSFDWFADGMMKSQTSPRGFTRNFQYDALGRITKITYPDATFEEFRYTHNGLTTGTPWLDKTYHRDRLGRVHKWEYNSDRQMTKYTNPLNHSWRYYYCDCGSIDQVIDPLNHSTNYTYDNRGRNTGITYPGSGGTVTYVYNELGQKTREVLPLGSRDFIYNNQGLLVKVLNHSGEETLINQYNIQDHLTQSTSAEGVTLTREFDRLGRPTKITQPGGSFDQMFYNWAGVTLHIDPLSKATSTVYDASGRKTQITNAESQIQSFTYAADDLLLTLTDGRSKTTTWEYDTEGRNISKRYHGDAYPTVRYVYFADGKLNHRRFYTSSTAYQQTSYTWDAVGNLTHVNYPTSADLAFVYNGRNEMTQMTDGLGVSTYAYSPSGQLLYEDGPFANDRVTYAYNTSRLRSSLTLQQSATTSWTQTYAYDSNRRLDAMTASRVSGTAFDYKYPTTSSAQLDPASSQWEELVFPGGAKIKLSFDTRARLTSTELKNSANTILNRHSYLYNTRNERTRQTLLSGKFIDYGYDDIGQIESANASVGNDFTYQYDAGWNLDKRFLDGVLNEDMTVNDKNIITQTSSGGTAQPDHKGNITLLNGATYLYDDENQLVWVQHITPNKAFSFLHDGKRRKRKQIEFNLVGSTWTPVAETWYIYDGMTVIQERSNSNVPTVHYTRGLDLSGSLGGAGGIGGLLTRSSGYNASTGAWSTHDYYHADGSGNITLLISNSTTPTVRAQYEYDPFGRIQTQSGTLASANTQRFSSKEQIGSSSLSYYGYRFYHAEAQRWMNRDPIEESGGLNLYGFVGNSHLKSIDFLGLEEVYIYASTFIRHPDAQSGVKTTHLVVVNEYGDIVRTSNTTGFTDIIGFPLKGTSTFKQWTDGSHPKITVKMIGNSNSAALPTDFDIDYNYTIVLDFCSRKGKFKGYHDSYPSYTLNVGDLRYDFHQQNLTGLLGAGGDVFPSGEFSF